MRPIDVDPLERARKIVYDCVLRDIEKKNDLRPPGRAFAAYSASRKRFVPLSGTALFAVAATVASALVILAVIAWFVSVR